MSHTENTVAWYVEWLNERNPEWTDEQRLEVAIGFAQQQAPPKPKAEEDAPETDEPQTEESAREQERAQARRHLNAKELQAILEPPKKIV
jgi:hypothetical protein